MKSFYSNTCMATVTTRAARLSDVTGAGNEESYRYYAPDCFPLNLDRGVVPMYEKTPSGYVLVSEKIPHIRVMRLMHSRVGQFFMLPLAKSRFFAYLVGKYKESRFSRREIDTFVCEFGIDMSEFIPGEGKEYSSFNSFFTRKLSLKGWKRRFIDQSPEVLVSPADSKCLIFKVKKGHRFWIKQSDFDLTSFVGGDKSLANQFENGSMIISRLSPHDYHRFHAPCDLTIERIVPISGELESVNPFAYFRQRKPLARNKRVIIVAHSSVFGRMIIAPVGAMMVGTIEVLCKEGQALKKGQEIGYFKIGGSTVVTIVKPGVKFDADIEKHSEHGFETKLLMGTVIGKKHFSS